jgi:hypothetical protein
MATNINAISTVYEITSRKKIGGDYVSVFVFVHDDKIEIVDKEMNPKPFVFCSRDTPAKRAFWLSVLKVIESAIKSTPTLSKKTLTVVKTKYVRN